MDSIADRLTQQITSIKRSHSPATVLITFSDGSQVGFDASNDKKPIPAGGSASTANEFASKTKTIRGGPHGPEVVFQDDSWVVCTAQNWIAMHPG